MRRVALIPVAVLAALLAVGPAPAQTAFEPALTVNDQVVTFYDLEQRMRLLVLNGAPQNAQLRDVALDQLIEDRLKREAALAAGVEAPQAAVDAAIEDYARQRNLTSAQLDAALARAGVARSALAEALGAQLGWISAVRRRYGGRVEIGEAELDQELALAAGAGAASFRLAEIALPFSARGEAATLAFAEDLARQLRAGGDFAAAARRHSASPSAAQGGDIGWTPETALPPAAAEAAAAAGPGGVTEPIPIGGGGVIILKVFETRTSAPADATPEQREALRGQLRSQRLTRLANGWMQEMLGDAVIERR
jgi:parvulin-like peptidyl-prolyl isomerase